LLFKRRVSARNSIFIGYSKRDIRRLRLKAIPLDRRGTFSHNTSSFSPVPKKGPDSRTKLSHPCDSVYESQKVEWSSEQGRKKVRTIKSKEQVIADPWPQTGHIPLSRLKRLLLPRSNLTQLFSPTKVGPPPPPPPPPPPVRQYTHNCG